MEQQMIRHYIILGNSYTRGYRVAIHQWNDTRDPILDQRGLLRTLRGLRVSHHSLVTDSISWQSVIEWDPYFSDVVVVDSLEEFISAVEEDHVLSKADVETYIRSVRNVSPHKMNAIINRCNEECIERLGYPLYNPLKKDCESAHIIDELISSNRILASMDGNVKLAIINSVLASA